MGGGGGGNIIWLNAILNRVPNTCQISKGEGGGWGGECSTGMIAEGNDEKMKNISKRAIQYGIETSAHKKY